MDKNLLTAALREQAELVRDAAELDTPAAADLKDAAELIRVLARVVQGDSLMRAFGAPRDWGYGTPIGKALAG